MAIILNDCVFCVRLFDCNRNGSVGRNVDEEQHVRFVVQEL